jgi:ABC-type transporter Mla MlaB component
VSTVLDEEGRVILSGELTFDTVAALYKATPRMAEGVTGVALSHVGRVDSAGLALLLEWQASALASGRRLVFTDAPEDLVRLAALCDADRLLGIQVGGEPGI